LLGVQAAAAGDSASGGGGLAPLLLTILPRRKLPLLLAERRTGPALTVLSVSLT
jgi:hypothetical protein